MSSAKDVKEALALKRQKLEELKKKREERATTGKGPSDDLASPISPVPVAISPTAVSSVASKPAATGHFDSPNAVLDRIDQMLGIAGKSPAGPNLAASPLGTQASTSERKVTLSETHLPEIEVIPVPVTTYEVGVQCGDADESKIVDEAEQERINEELREKNRQMRESKEKEEAERKQREEEERKARELTTTQKKQIMELPDFQDFFTKTSLLVERALSQNDRYDVTVDYSRTEEKKKKGNSLLSSCVTFCDKNKCFNRPVTAIDWSPKSPDLLLAAYSQKEDVLSLEPDGLVLLWSHQMTQRPERYFYCQSAVLTAQFHPTDPMLIIGGTQSGQVVIWDIRQKSTPVTRSSLSDGHIHPIYALAVMPARNAIQSVISVSTDGHMCVWNDQEMLKPFTQIDLKYDKKDSTSHEKKDVTINSMDVPGGEADKLILGSEEGNIYKAHIYENQGISECVPAHDAPITAVDYHPVDKNAPRDYSTIFLTSSYDWTVKLWAYHSPKPLLVFENAKDYVYDVQWSPVHPAVFAFGDGSGDVSFWNLNEGTETPKHTCQAVDPDEKEQKLRKSAVSRLRWSNDGSKLAVGASDGNLLVWDVAPELYKSSDNDSQIFYEKIQNIQTGVQ